MSGWAVGSVFDFGWKPRQTPNQAKQIQFNPIQLPIFRLTSIDTTAADLKSSLDGKIEHERFHDETRGFSRPANPINYSCRCSMFN
ncbi:MAG: hypothetical protein J07HQX50_00043 [Haloquadratum sp. J07HQX50]|nr:MAG: hypothetical protein J07HQX50_00043 [Haloquadratum sp. J07HQX50]